MICSAARRTRQTWQYVAARRLGGEPEFAAERRLYEADSEDVAEIVRQTPASVRDAACTSGITRPRPGWSGC